jgi:phosphoribosylpyrophosphate synthetase
MIDTGGTLAKAADLMMEKGALSVRAICTHAILSGDATKNRKISIIRINSYRFYSIKERI